MKICLYLEFYHFAGGILFKNVGTGLLSSYRNQKKELDALGVEYVERWSDDCDILQANTPWLKSIYLMKRAKRRGKKTIVFSHVTVEDAMQVFRFMPLIAPLFKKYLTYAYGLADLVLCPTEYTRSLVLAYGIPPERTAIQSNGVDVRKFYESAEKRETERNERGLEGVVVGTVGLIIPRKGVDTFLALARRFAQNQFVWYGKIYSRVLVRPLHKDWPENAKFTGYVKDILAAFNSLDIFIFPSYEENQGMVLLEAAAVGLPLLVRDIPVYEGWLRDGENCLKAKNEADFVEKLDRLIKDGGLRKRLSEGAKKLAASESLEEQAKRLAEHYRKLLQ